VPVLRRFSGGGTVYHDLDNLNFSFLVPKKHLEDRFAPGAPDGPRQYIDFFRSVIVAALSRGGTGYSATGVSDVSLNGRKVSGNAQRIASNLVLHHGTLMRRCPLAAISRYLPIPPDRPGVPHERFVTGLAEEGREHSEGELMSWLSEELAQRLGLSV
jgi:lipoate-protein ligase A